MSITGKPLSIDRNHLEEFKIHISSGMTKKQAAKSVGFSLGGIRYALRKFGITIEKNELIDRVSQRKSEIRASNKPQWWWAREFGVTQPAIHKVFRKLNLNQKRGNKSKPGPACDHPKHISEYRQILAYLQEHGGYIPHAIKALGLKTLPQGVRNFAREIGMEPTHWQFAWKTYGLWLVLPGPWKKLPPANYSVPAICQGCGVRAQLNLANAKTGRTNGCIQCAQSARCFDKVMDCQTGEIYPSIMSWTKAVGVLKQYQKYRLQIQNKESVEIEGNVYKLLVE